MIEHLTEEQLNCIRALAPALIERPRYRYTTQMIKNDFEFTSRRAVRNWLSRYAIERFYARGCLWILWESLVNHFLQSNKLPPVHIPSTPHYIQPR